MSKHNHGPSEMEEEYQMLKDIKEAKRNENEPGRREYVISALREKGYKPTEDQEQKCIRFDFRGNTITIWPYTGWFSGKGVKDGRGIKKLLKQI